MAMAVVGVGTVGWAADSVGTVVSRGRCKPPPGPFGAD